MNQMKRILGSVLVCALSSNIAWADDAVEAKGGQARVRFFGQAVIGLTFFKNQSCYGRRGIQASRAGLGGAFGSTKNISLGIPETPNVTNLKARDGIITAAFYREYEVRSGNPLAILATYTETTGPNPHFIGQPTGYFAKCENIGAYFTPEDGKDYEVSLDIKGQACHLTVNQIASTDAGVQLTPVAVAEAKKCTAQDVLPLDLCKATLAECKEGVTEKFRETSPEGKPDKAAFASCTAEYKTCAAATK
jgi:hypothetical protein